jgi:hypothetical protein
VVTKKKVKKLCPRLDCNYTTAYDASMNKHVDKVHGGQPDVKEEFAIV